MLGQLDKNDDTIFKTEEQHDRRICLQICASVLDETNSVLPIELDFQEDINNDFPLSPKLWDDETVEHPFLLPRLEISFGYKSDEN